MHGDPVKIRVENADGEVEAEPARADEKVELVKKSFRGEVIQGGE